MLQQLRISHIITLNHTRTHTVSTSHFSITWAAWQVAFIEMARALLPLFTMAALYFAALETPTGEWPFALLRCFCTGGSRIARTVLLDSCNACPAPHINGSSVLVCFHICVCLEGELVRAVLLTAAGCAVSAYGEVGALTDFRRGCSLWHVPAPGSNPEAGMV